MWLFGGYSGNYLDTVNSIEIFDFDTKESNYATYSNTLIQMTNALGWIDGMCAYIFILHA